MSKHNSARHSPGDGRQASKRRDAPTVLVDPEVTFTEPKTGNYSPGFPQAQLSTQLEMP